MKLRYIEIDPDIIAELPDWSQTEIERESERTLKDLGIARQDGESYLLSWVRTMFAENDCEENPETRQRLIEAIRQDWKAQLFVWVLGGDERKAFGVDDSPAFREYLVIHHAARSLAPGCFYDHDDPRYWDYQPQPGWRRPARKPVPTGLVARTALGLLVVAAGAWAAKGLSAPVGWRIADAPVLLVWLGLTAAGVGLLLGLSAKVGDESGPLQRLVLWVAVPAALTAVALHLNASRKLEADAVQRERSVPPPLGGDANSLLEEVGYIQQIKRADHLWEPRREIYWFVKIPATNELYSCSWESGFAGFARDDAVRLVHRKPDMQTDDNSGFLVELHGRQVVRFAAVEVVDVDDLRMPDLDER